VYRAAAVGRRCATMNQTKNAPAVKRRKNAAHSASCGIREFENQPAPEGRKKIAQRFSAGSVPRKQTKSRPSASPRSPSGRQDGPCGDGRFRPSSAGEAQRKCRDGRPRPSRSRSDRAPARHNHDHQSHLAPRRSLTPQLQKAPRDGSLSSAGAKDKAHAASRG
jgi:hypothetical protein